MNKEEIEELKDFTIDLTDIDELALGLEVCSKKSNMVDNMKYRKNRPLAYKIYTYLKENAVGYDNRIKSNELMRIFDINTNETLRTYIQEIRESDTLQKIVCSEASVTGGYWIATNENEVYQTLQHLYNRSMKMLHTYSIIKRKCRLNNQLRMKLNKYEKEIYESIMEEK